MIEKRMKLVRNGSAQAIEIPAEFALPGEEVLLQAEDGCLTLVPIRRPSLLATLASLSSIDEDWPQIEDQPPEAVDS